MKSVRRIYESELFHRRLQVLPAFWQYCDECGQASPTGKPAVYYVMGVRMREVILCLECALNLHDTAEALGKKVDVLLLERY